MNLDEIDMGVQDHGCRTIEEQQRKHTDGSIVLDDVNVHELRVFPEEEIPIESEITVKDFKDGMEKMLTECSDIIETGVDNFGFSLVENRLPLSSDKMYLLHDDDVDLAAQAGLIRRPHKNRTPLIPDRKAMRVCHNI